MRRTLAGPGSSTGTYKATLDPGRSQASSAKGSPADFYSKQNQDLQKEVGQGASLKHVETTDKSKPQIEKDVHVKKVDRTPFINEVQGQHDLKHVDQVADRSEPHIEADTHVKQVDRGAFLASVEAAAQEKGADQ